MANSLIRISLIVCCFFSFYENQSFAASNENNLPVPLVRQATHYSCGAAALSAVLQYWKVFDGGEGELYRIAGTTQKNGTPPSGIVRAAQSFGLRAEFKEGLTITDLKKYLQEKIPVIIDVQAWTDDPNDGIAWKDRWEDGHYVVVIGMTEKSIMIMDPSTAARYAYIPQNELLDRWHDYENLPDGKIWRNHQLGIIIRGEQMLEVFPASPVRMY